MDISGHSNDAEVDQILSDLTCRVMLNDPALSQVNIRHIPAECVTADQIESILSALKYNTHVNTLELWLPSPKHVNVHTADTDCQQPNYSFLVDTLACNNHLKRLSISSVDCSFAWQSLCLGLSYNSSIEELVLGDASGMIEHDINLLDETACISIRDFLACESFKNKQSSLKSFTMRGFALSQRSLNILAEGFELNAEGPQSLQDLELHQIEIIDSDQRYTHSSCPTDAFHHTLSCIAEREEGTYNGFGNMLLALSLSKNLERITIIDCDLSLCESSFLWECDTETGASCSMHPLETLFARTKSLQRVRLIECHLDRVSSTMKSLSQGLARNSSVQLLDLRDNEISEKHCKYLAQMLYFNRTLSKLILEQNMIDDNALQNLCEGLKYNSSLQHLNMRGNHISGTGCAALVDVLAKTGISKLEALSLSDNDIRDDGAKIVGTILHSNPHLKKLELEACHITDEGILHLCSGLLQSRLSLLQDLNISHNKIQERGAHAISTVLACNRVALQSLNMTSCQINDVAAEILLTNLANGMNKNLQNLYLPFNNIGNDGAVHIGKMLQSVDCKLSKLNVQFNKFSLGGLPSIVMGLRNNYYLKELLIWNSNCNQETIQLVEEINHWLSLNASGRCAILEMPSTGPSMWPSILARADGVYGPTAVYHLLLEAPHITC